jgi:hypothetical protein
MTSSRGGTAAPLEELEEGGDRSWRRRTLEERGGGDELKMATADRVGRANPRWVDSL